MLHKPECGRQWRAKVFIIPSAFLTKSYYPLEIMIGGATFPTSELIYLLTPRCLISPQKRRGPLTTTCQSGGIRRIKAKWPSGHLLSKDATFHGEKHTQAGTWSDLGRHLKDAAKQTVGLKP